MFSVSPRPSLLVTQPTYKPPKKQLLFLTPTSATPFPPLPLTPVPPTPRSSPTESDASLPSSSSSTASEDSNGLLTPPSPPVSSIDSEYYAPELPQFLPPAQVPSIHYILSRPSFDLSLPLATLLYQVPPEHLNQPATSPPMSSLFITTPLFPWYIHVTPGASPHSPLAPVYSAVLPCTPAVSNTRPPASTFQYSASPPTLNSSIFPADDDEYFVPPDALDAYITIYDIITTLHTSIRAQIKSAEYNSFSETIKDAVARSYHTRIAHLDERGLRKSRKKGALRMDVLPLGYTRVAGFFVGSWDPEKREAAWGVEFGLSVEQSAR